MDSTIVCVREGTLIIVVGSFEKLCCKVGPKEISLFIGDTDKTMLKLDQEMVKGSGEHMGLLWFVLGAAL